MKAIVSSLVFFFVLLTGLQAQTLTKNEAFLAGIKTVTVMQNNLSDRKSRSVPESISSYDSQGNDRNGSLISQKTYKYEFHSK